MHLADVVFDPDVLLALEPEELGLRILQALAAWSPQLSQIHKHSLRELGRNPSFVLLAGTVTR
jgi:hypothetical protein